MKIDDAIVLDPSNEQWPAAFAAEVSVLTKALGDHAAQFTHIGSTAVSGLAAKPIIDILGAVVELGAIDKRRSDCERLGYEWLGEFGLVGRRFLVKRNTQGLRSVHLHFFVRGDRRLQEHIRFRDLLRTSPALCSQYTALKQELARRHSHDRIGYMDGKASFIAEALAMQS